MFKCRNSLKLYKFNKRFGYIFVEFLEISINVTTQVNSLY